MTLSNNNLSRRLKQIDWLHAAAYLLFGLVLLAVALTVAWFNGVDLWPEPPQSNYQKAVAEFKTAIELEPGNPEGYRWLAKAYTLAGQPAAAIEVYRQAIAANPDQGWPYAELGQYYEQQGDTEQALALYKQAIELEPEDPAAYQQLGAVYQQQGELDKAIAVYEQAAGVYPDQYWYYKPLGELYLADGQTEKALAAYEQAGVFQPDDADLQLKLGELYRWGLGQLDQALIHYQRAVDLTPDMGWYHAVLASALFAAGQPEAGARHRAQALALQPDDPAIQKVAGELYLQAGDLAQAQTYLEQAVTSTPDDPYLYLNLIRLHKRLKNYRDALGFVNKSLVLAPENLDLVGQVQLEHAQILAAVRQFSQAEDAFQQAAQARPNNSRVYYLWGYFYQEQGRYLQAIEKYQRSAELEPDSAWPHIALAEAYLQQQDNRNGLHQLQLALVAEPDNLAVREQAQRLLGNTPQLVLPMLTALPDLSPNQLPVYLAAGQLLGQFEQWPAAIQIYQRALGQGWTDALIYTALGDAYAAVGNQNQANVYYEQANRVSPDGG